jgi:SagB-type dehydrogenase family enzyme
MNEQQGTEKEISLPEAARDGETSVEASLAARGSVRDYSKKSLSLAELGQLLWAAQGTTTGGRRTTPSAGALYPLEIYVLAGSVDGLDCGLYRYRPTGHKLLQTDGADLRAALASAALSQEQVEKAAAVIVIAAVVERTAAKYGQRAARYVHIEVGAAAENVYLQATALELGTVYIGAFSDTRVKQVLKLPEAESPFAILPVGRPR